MPWENWMIAISVLVIAIAFIILVIFVILALVSLKRMTNDLNQKVHAFDPIFRVVSKAGDVIERKTEKQLADVEAAAASQERELRRNGGVNTAMEVAEWAMVGLALWQKIKEKRRL
jgi:uncharacterized protein YoxC